MPSSPKVFHSHRPSARLRLLSVFFAACFLCTVAGFLLGSFSASLPLFSSHRCAGLQARSIHVAWDRGGGNGDGGSGGSGGALGERRKVVGFVGVQTGFGSMGRRRSLRRTWFPSDREGLQRLEEATGLVFKFVIGKTSDKRKMAALQREVEEYDDFLLLDIEEQYKNLPFKTLAFFKAAYALFDADFYVKADDDIYLRPDRLSLLLVKDRPHPLTYLGCLKKGPVFTDPNLKWYEPLAHLLGKEYFLHAYGPIYALSADVVKSLVALRNSSFRMFSNEDVTIGAWMLAVNVNHEDNRGLCAPDCTPSSIAVWDIPKCSGLCNPEAKLLQLHQRAICSKSPTVADG